MKPFAWVRPRLYRGRTPTRLGRALVVTTCLTLVFSGALLPGAGRAQLPVFLPDSLKDTPRPVPTAAVILAPIDNIPGPGIELNFQPLDVATTTPITIPDHVTDLGVGIVKDQAALIALGKALFWDMQVGSDGVQSCATCHFNAGADVRSKNQISPGVKDANFLNNPLDGGAGDTRFGNSTVPFTANDPLNPSGPLDPPDPIFSVPGLPQFAPNYQLVATDFPLNGWFNPTALVPRGPGIGPFEELALVDQDTNDVVSSMGVRRTQFVSTTPGKAVDAGTPLPDVFNTRKPGEMDTASRVRRVEPRNAPSVINAVFNFDNFWDGRASFIFNGANPFGFRDRESTLKLSTATGPVDVFVRVTNSSLASQAVGPPGSDFEMSWAGRTFPDIGKKLLTMQPLAKQLVHPKDSVLGPMSRARVVGSTLSGLKGLKDRTTGRPTTYTQMVQAAFQDQWWNDTTSVFTPIAGSAVVQKASASDPRTLVLSPGKAAVSKRALGAPLGAGQYTQMMWNFSLFWGLAVQAYEATLISDDTPYDRFQGATSLGIDPDPTALTDQEQLGLAIFDDPGIDGSPGNGAKCNNCHILPISSGHTVLDMKPDAQGVPQSTEGIIEDMVMGDGTVANYDHGMYNIAVRRTQEDLGRAGTAPFTNPLTGAPFPLSYVELTALNSSTACTDPSGVSIPCCVDDNRNPISCLPPDVARFVPDVPMQNRRVTEGAFKVPSIRNALYTGPYMHNGDSATLRQVVEFYIRGGNFPNTNANELTVDIEGINELRFPEFIPAAREGVEALVAFLANALTDPRVALEKAPFDHPQLFVPNGSPARNPAADTMLEIKAVGNAGRPNVRGKSNPIPTFLKLDPRFGG